jgi:cytoskeleton-associated protein 5
LNIGDILSDILIGMNHKNPQVKLETVKWLIRCIKSPSISRKDIIPKAEIKPLMESLTKTLDDGLESIRERSAEAFGILCIFIPERTMNQYLERLDKSKLAKILEFSSKGKLNAPVIEVNPKRPSPPTPKKSLSSGKSSQSASRRPSANKPTKSIADVALLKTPDTIPTIRYEFTDDSAMEYVMEKWPPIIGQLTNTNWKIRLEAMTNLLEYVSSEDLKSEAIIKCLLSKPGWKENNFQVSATMCNIFTKLVETPEFNTSCSLLIMSGLIIRLGDVKIKKVAGDCLEKIAQKTSLEYVFSEAYECLKNQKSPKLIADGLSWMNSTLLEFGIVGISVKKLILFLKGMLTNTNNNVRTAGVSVLLTARRFLGPSIRDLLLDLNPAILTTIDAEFEKVATLAAPIPVKQNSTPISVMSDEDIITKIDISSKLSAEVIKAMSDANWKERKIALDNVLQVIEATNFRIQPSLPSDFITALKARLGDSNKNLASTAVEICGLLTTSIGKPFEKHLRNLLPPMLAQLCDQKANVRMTVLTNIDKIASSIGISLLLSVFPAALMNDNPYCKKELLQWTLQKIDFKENVDFVPIIQPLLACLQDRNSDARKLSQSLLTKLSEKVPISQIESMASDAYRGAALASVMSALENIRKETAVTAYLPINTPQIEAKPVVNEDESKKAPRKPSSKPSTSSLSLKKEVLQEVVEYIPPFLVADFKYKEIRGNADRGVNKWVFDSPRRELLDLLAEQASHNLSPDACKLLFSSDHYKEKDFLAGIKLLDDFIRSDGFGKKHELCIANCDIVLKYLTIRFFDTNTTILIKCFDFLEHFLSILDEAAYSFNEYEASCFIPFFVQKLGDPKETLRVKLRSILKQLARVYPSSKLFLFLMKGIDSKNSRTRAECLDEISSLLQRNGVGVFNAAKVLPVLASQVGDRDATVRNSSLSAISQAYMLMGDEVFKHIGRLNEKDKGIIKERIRRLPASSTEPESDSILTKNDKHIFKQSEYLIKPVTPKSSTPKKREDFDLSSVPKHFSLDFDNLEIDITSQPSKLKTPRKSFSRIATTCDSIESSKVLEDSLDLAIDASISKVINAANYRLNHQRWMNYRMQSNN